MLMKFRHFYLAILWLSLLHWNKVELHSPKDAICYFWLKLAQWFWRKKIFWKLSVYIYHFPIISPCERVWPLIWRNCAQEWFVPSLVKLAQWLWRIRGKLTSLQIDKQTDDGRSEKYTWAFSSYKLNFKQKYYKNCTLKDKYPSFKFTYCAMAMNHCNMIL